MSTELVDEGKYLGGMKITILEFLGTTTDRKKLRVSDIAMRVKF